MTAAVIHTMDPAHPRAEALAVRDGSIVHVGSPHASVQAFIGPETTQHDLGTHAVLPGLHDSHTHLAWSATELEDVVLADARTPGELGARIAAHAARLPDEPWIRGSGWDSSLFDSTLHRSQLDAIEPHRPIYMTAADSHSAWVNSAALAQAGITARTPDPERGRIERDALGEPTGILREEAMSLVSRHLPPYMEAYTINGARASFVEHELGSITVGKRADLVVVERDPFAIDARELSELRVLRTFLDGREVYRARH